MLVKPFDEYFGDYQDAVDRLLTLTPTVESVDDLPDEEAQLAFVTAFRDVMRLKNILESFADFDDAAKPLSDQTLADFTSKYLDIHDKVKKHSSKEKVSILEDVDFEVSLIHRDEINVITSCVCWRASVRCRQKSSRSRRKDHGYCRQ